MTLGASRVTDSIQFTDPQALVLMWFSLACNRTRTRITLADFEKPRFARGCVLGFRLSQQVWCANEHCRTEKPLSKNEGRKILEPCFRSPFFDSNYGSSFGDPTGLSTPDSI